MKTHARRPHVEGLRAMPFVFLTAALLAAPVPCFGQTSAPDPTVDQGPLVLVWLTAGGGLASEGLAGLVGGSVSVDGWSVDVRYLKSMSTGSSVEEYTDHLGALIGRSLGSSGRTRVGIGAARSHRWTTQYRACSDCWFGGQRRVGGSRSPQSLSVALAIATRSRPVGGVLGIAGELSAFLGGDATTVGVSFTIDAGKLR